jgi:lactoylglutathione lyase
VLASLEHGERFSHCARAGPVGGSGSVEPVPGRQFPPAPARLPPAHAGGDPSRGDFRNPVENVDGELVTIGAGPLAVDLNLLEPIDPDRSPRAHLPPLNHVGLWVDDLPAAIAWLTGQGLEFTERGVRRGAAGHDVCFIHPRRGGEGVLIELIQAPPEVVDEFERWAGSRGAAAGLAGADRANR